MALLFGIAPGVKHPVLFQFQRLGEFNYNEASFWFLWPFWKKLQSETGQLVDPYGMAFFGGVNLDALGWKLKEARAVTRSKKEEWQVLVGWEGVVGGRESRQLLSKAEMNTLLDALEQAIAQAKQENLLVVFLGY